MNTTDFFQKYRIISKTKNPLLFVGEYFLKISKIQFLRERVNKKYWSVSAGRLLGLSELKQQKDSWSFVSLIKKGPNFMETKSKEETT